MKSLAIKYKTVNRLLSFLDKQIFKESVCDIVVQIFYPTYKQSLLKDIISILKKNITKPKIIGCDSEQTLINQAISKDIVIHFFLLPKNSIEIKYLKNKYFLLDNFFELNFVYSIDIDRYSFIEKKESVQNLIATFHHKSIIYDGEIYNSGAVLLSIKQEFDFDIKVVDYIEPIGRKLRFKKHDKNSIKKVYEHYLSNKFAKDLYISSQQFPLLKKDKEVYKASLIYEDGENIRFDYKVEPKDTFKIGFSNSPIFYKKYIDTLNSFDNCKSEFIFVISSIAKFTIFEEEGFDFDNGLGFFSNSELIIENTKVYDINLSIILINFYNKNSKVLKYPYYKIRKYQKDNFHTIEALSNIAKISSQELEELNQELEKRVEQEVEKNLKKDAILIHQSRLAQMGEMISLIAHQWKQPLSAISATSSGLQIKIELDMYDREFFLNSLIKIEEFVNHLANTIDDFSNFFKPTKIKKLFSLDEAVKKALNIATYSLSKNSIDVDINLQKGLKIKSYQNELIQVILNILKNAENILIKREVENPKIFVKVFQKGENKIIQIKDNGGGVEEKIKDKIFEPYFSTKATKNSTGLGLYMSKFIVEDSLGGKLLFENSANGAVFSIVL